MLHIEHNRPLKPLTTFKIGGPARFFAEITDTTDLPEAFAFAEERKLPVLVLGGGSNMLVSDRGFEGLVVQVKNRGIDDRLKPVLQIGSGEIWDDVVKFAVQHELWGIEIACRLHRSS